MIYEIKRIFCSVAEENLEAATKQLAQEKSARAQSENDWQVERDADQGVTTSSGWVDLSTTSSMCEG